MSISADGGAYEPVAHGGSCIDSCLWMPLAYSYSTTAINIMSVRLEFSKNGIEVDSVGIATQVGTHDVTLASAVLEKDTFTPYGESGPTLYLEVRFETPVATGQDGVASISADATGSRLCLFFFSVFFVALFA